MRPGLDELGHDLGAGPALGHEVRRAQHVPVAHHAGEAARGAVGRRELLGQSGELLDQEVRGHRVGRRDLHPVGHERPTRAEHVGLEPRTPDVDGQRVGMLVGGAGGRALHGGDCSERRFCRVRRNRSRHPRRTSRMMSRSIPPNSSLDESGEGLAGEEQTREHDADRGGHLHPVPQRHPCVRQDPAELVLDVLVLGVVVLAVQLLEGRLVALVHEEELALGQHLVDDLVQQRAPLLERDGLVPHLHERVPAGLVQAHVQRQQDVVLGGEVVVEGRLGDAQLLGDLPQARAVEALLGEEVEGRIEDALPGVDRGGLGRLQVQVLERRRVRSGSSGCTLLVYLTAG